MFSTDFVCFYFKTWDQTQGTGQTGHDGQVINLNLPNVHLLLYMDVKGCVMLNLDFTPCQLISLDLVIVHI